MTRSTTGLTARVLVFVLSAAALLALGIGYTIHTVDKERGAAANDHGPRPEGGAVQLTANGTPRLVVRDTAAGPGYGRIASVALSAPADARQVDTRACERSYAAAGKLVCLTATGSLVLSQEAEVIDADGKVRYHYSLPGLPSRARLSADGRMAAWTSFVYGDSYTSIGFSTRAAIVDTATGKYVSSLEQFTAYRNGKPFNPSDRNFWGVTFAADDNTFYATLGSASNGGTFLVRGDFARRTLTVLDTNVECPSLSPDGTRIAFKRRVSSDQTAPWRLYVLDLATMKMTPLADTRSVDDQADWIDDNTVAYGIARADGASDVWSQPADGSGKPHLLVPNASSPSVLR